VSDQLLSINYISQSKQADGMPSLENIICESPWHFFTQNYSRK